MVPPFGWFLTRETNRKAVSPPFLGAPIQPPTPQKRARALCLKAFQPKKKGTLFPPCFFFGWGREKHPTSLSDPSFARRIRLSRERFCGFSAARCAPSPRAARGGGRVASGAAAPGAAGPRQSRAAEAFAALSAGYQARLAGCGGWVGAERWGWGLGWSHLPIFMGWKMFFVFLLRGKPWSLGIDIPPFRLTMDNEICRFRGVKAEVDWELTHFPCSVPVGDGASLPSSLPPSLPPSPPSLPPSLPACLPACLLPPSLPPLPSPPLPSPPLPPSLPPSPPKSRRQLRKAALTA